MKILRIHSVRILFFLANLLYILICDKLWFDSLRKFNFVRSVVLIASLVNMDIIHWITGHHWFRLPWTRLPNSGILYNFIFLMTIIFIKNEICTIIFISKLYFIYHDNFKPFIANRLDFMNIKCFSKISRNLFSVYNNESPEELLTSNNIQFISVAQSIFTIIEKPDEDKSTLDHYTFPKLVLCLLKIDRFSVSKLCKQSWRYLFWGRRCV